MPRITDIDPDWITEKALKRFYEKTARQPNGCIVWTGSCSTKGYGRFKLDGHFLSPHRLILVIETGERLPPDLVVDHLCRNPSCLNSEHLELVTHAENTARGENANAYAARAGIDRNECGRGHDKAVFGRVTTSGRTRCTACDRIYSARKEATRKADPAYREKHRLRTREYRTRLRQQQELTTNESKEIPS